MDKPVKDAAGDTRTLLVCVNVSFGKRLSSNKPFFIGYQIYSVVVQSQRLANERFKALN